MRFSPSRRRPRAESIVPMINVVFLLLIFFLMTAELAPAPPFEVDLPASAAEPGEAGQALHVGAGGQLAYGALRGDAALEEAVGAGETVLVRADRALPGADLARLLARLSALGAARVSLAVEAE